MRHERRAYSSLTSAHVHVQRLEGFVRQHGDALVPELLQELEAAVGDELGRAVQKRHLLAEAPAPHAPAPPLGAFALLLGPELRDRGLAVRPPAAHARRRRIRRLDRHELLLAPDRVPFRRASREGRFRVRLDALRLQGIGRGGSRSRGLRAVIVADADPSLHGTDAVNTVRFGKMTSTRSGYYVMLEGRDAIYIISDTGVTKTIFASLSDFLLAPVLTLALVLPLGYLVKKYLPTVWAVLNGYIPPYKKKATK